MLLLHHLLTCSTSAVAGQAGLLWAADQHGSVPQEGVGIPS